MNWPEAFSKLGAQMNRIFGNGTVSEDASPAEVVSALENLDSIEDIRSKVSQNDDTVTQFEDRVSALESTIADLTSKLEVLNDVDFEAINTSLEELNSLKDEFDTKVDAKVDALRTELAEELNNVKTSKSGPQPKNNAKPPIPKKENEADDAPIEANMGDFMNGTVGHF